MQLVPLYSDYLWNELLIDDHFDVKNWVLSS